MFMRARIFCAAAMTLAASSAYAASNTLVVLPWGTLVNEVLAGLQPIAVSIGGLAVAWLAAKLGPDIGRALHAAHIDQVMTRAIEAAFALVEGAEKGKVLEIPVANEVLRRAAQYLVAQAPGLFKELGGNLGQMLVARLSAAGALPPQASAANLDLAPVARGKLEGPVT
jgi:hypothetical protein